MAQSDENKQPETARRKWAGPVGRDAAASGSEAFARAGFSDPAIVLRWEEIAGAEVSKLAIPLKLAEGAQGGVLTLKAEPGAAVFLQHESRALCERINAFLGRDAVARLRFVQGPLQTRPKLARIGSAKGAVPANDPSLGYRGKPALGEALVGLAARRAGRAKQAD